MGYLPLASVEPTRTILKEHAALFKNSGGLDGLISFYGHGSANSMSWNYLSKGGEYAVGITSYGNQSAGATEYISINEFKMANARICFIFWM